jgi:hypothetical protein
MFELQQQPDTDDFVVVSCLQCGRRRSTWRSETGHLEPAECGSCGYVGWLESTDELRVNIEE